MLVHATLEAFRALAAADVRIAEGPGHRRNTLDLADAAGYFDAVPGFEDLFTDLNLDEISKFTLRKPFSKLADVYLPNTILGADLVVSMPKMKTHHWAGVTLSMKNLFGVVPGVAYGWPKNALHWKGIDRSILDINSVVPAHFVIADGIIGMEGNGPLHGSPRHLGRIVLADDPVAADFVCSRLMGLNPLRVKYLAQGAEFLGNGTPERIVHLGERLPATIQPFAVMPEFARLCL
jgi:uncharacterized protein (DUF362 family)